MSHQARADALEDALLAQSNGASLALTAAASAPAATAAAGEDAREAHAGGFLRAALPAYPQSLLPERRAGELLAVRRSGRVLSLIAHLSAS
jgi:hypothetical protein